MLILQLNLEFFFQYYLSKLQFSSPIYYYLQRDNRRRGLVVDLIYSYLQRDNRSGREFAPHVGDRGSIPGREMPKSLKQVVTAPLPNARQQV